MALLLVVATAGCQDGTDDHSHPLFPAGTLGGSAWMLIPGGELAGAVWDVPESAWFDDPGIGPMVMLEGLPLGRADVFLFSIRDVADPVAMVLHVPIHMERASATGTTSTIYERGDEPFWVALAAPDFRPGDRLGIVVAGEGVILRALPDWPSYDMMPTPATLRQAFAEESGQVLPVQTAQGGTRIAMYIDLRATDPPRLQAGRTYTDAMDWDGPPLVAGATVRAHSLGFPAGADAGWAVASGGLWGTGGAVLSDRDLVLFGRDGSAAGPAAFVDETWVAAPEYGLMGSGTGGHALAWSVQGADGGTIDALAAIHIEIEAPLPDLIGVDATWDGGAPGGPPTFHDSSSGPVVRTPFGPILLGNAL